ncbi:MAG TPA: class I SAM-dependent methyltransferase, partial [Candidatus Limnocylindrales bacterium]
MADNRHSQRARERTDVSTSGDALARYYDLDLETDPGDLDMYLAFADAGAGTVLELMAGSGRISVPLAEAGYKVTAVDNEPAMLSRAAARWQRTSSRARKGGALDLVEADVTTLELGKRFDLIIVAFNSLLLLDDRATQAQTLEGVARHLKPSGRAVIDVWLPQPDDLALYDGRLVLDWTRIDAESGQRVAKSTAARYEAAARTARISTFFDAWNEGESPARTSRRDTVNFLNQDELER